jgi:hypothetical protein
MSSTKLLAAGVMVLASTGCAIAAQGREAPPAGRRIVLDSTLDTRSLRTNDVRPRGPSAGDQFTYAATLRRGGAAAGRLEGVGVATDPRYDGGVQVVTLVLADGTLAAQGGGPDKRTPGLPPPARDSIFAVTGGTGAYTGAAGTMSLRDVSRSTARITIFLDR